MLTIITVVTITIGSIMMMLTIMMDDDDDDG